MQTSRVTSLAIHTPEGIVFSLPLASPVTRCLAWAVDFACVGALSVGMRVVISPVGLISVDLSAALTVIGFFVIQIGYGIICEWAWRGQTVGKRLLRLRVMDAGGMRLQFDQIALRNLVRFVDMLPAFYMTGGLACLISSRAQRLGDFVANTIVVHHVETRQPDLDQLLAGKYNSLRDAPHLEARLRQRVSPREAAVALQALLRRDQLEPRARVELFDQIAAHFQAQVAFPPDLVEGITSEQYVRNVADIIFRPRSRNSKPDLERAR